MFKEKSEIPLPNGQTLDRRKKTPARLICQHCNYCAAHSFEYFFHSEQCPVIARHARGKLWEKSMGSGRTWRRFNATSLRISSIRHTDVLRYTCQMLCYSHYPVVVIPVCISGVFRYVSSTLKVTCLWFGLKSPFEKDKTTPAMLYVLYAIY